MPVLGTAHSNLQEALAETVDLDAGVARSRDSGVGLTPDVQAARPA